MSKLIYRIFGLDTNIDKYNKFRTKLFCLGIVSVFFNMCIWIGAENTPGNDTVSQAIYLTIFSLIQVGLLMADIRYQKKIWLCKYEIYRIETEDFECKKRVAEIKNEALPDNLINKSIKAPDANHISIKKYVLLLVINVVIIIMWLNKV